MSVTPTALVSEQSELVSLTWTRRDCSIAAEAGCDWLVICLLNTSPAQKVNIGCWGVSDWLYGEFVCLLGSDVLLGSDAVGESVERRFSVRKVERLNPIRIKAMNL